MLRRSSLGQSQAVGPQPSGTSTAQSNLLSASRIPGHTASSLAERTPPPPSLCPATAPASAKPNIPHVEQQGDTLVDVSSSRPYPLFLAQCPAPHVACAPEMAVEYTTAPPKRQGSPPSVGRLPISRLLKPGIVELLGASTGTNGPGVPPSGLLGQAHAGGDAPWLGRCQEPRAECICSWGS